MQNPVTRRIVNQTPGFTNTEWTSTAVEAMDARAEKTRTWPTLPKALIVNLEPIRKPA